MPGGDGTGPLGMGARTGRGMGFCNGYNNPGFTGRGFGRGFRRGFGRGLGLRRAQVYSQVVQPTKDEERKALEDDIKELDQEKKVLEQQIESIKKRIEEINQQK